MCGRFTQKAPRENVGNEFSVKKTPAKQLFEPRYNIAPTQMIAAVRELENSREAIGLKWALVLSWAKDSDIGNRMINARAETLQEKPSFREAFRRRRCVIPASGFYEWQRVEKGAKQPHYFYLKEKEVFGFAGLWEEWLDKTTGEPLETCTIITAEANEVLRPVHDRMPVILRSRDYGERLDPKVKDTDKLQKLLVPYPAKEMDSHPVSRNVTASENTRADSGDRFERAPADCQIFEITPASRSIDASL